MKKLGPGLFWASILVAVFVLLWALSYGIAGFLGIDSLGCTPGDRACLDLRAVDLPILALRLEAVGIASSLIATFALAVTVVFSARATKAATEASRAAAHSMEHLDYYSSLEFRPYLVSGNVTQEWDKASNGAIARLRYGVEIKNTGKTPARRVIAQVDSDLFDTPVRHDWTFPYSQKNHATLMIGPGLSIIQNGRWFSHDEIREVIDKKKRMHIWGWVEYQGFRYGERYRTEFHYTVLLSGDSHTEGALYRTAHLGEGHNGMDETCKRSTLSLFTTDGPLKFRNDQYSTKDDG